MATSALLASSSSGQFALSLRNQSIQNTRLFFPGELNVLSQFQRRNDRRLRGSYNRQDSVGGGGFGGSRERWTRVSRKNSDLAAARRNGANLQSSSETPARAFAAKSGGTKASTPGVEETLDVDVAIVGGGPGGLAAACAIRRTRPDLSVAVFERAENFGRVGGLIAVTSNGMSALEAIDPALKTAVQSLRLHPTNRYSVDLKGEIFLKVPTMYMTDPDKASLIQWYKLQRTLADALPPDTIHLGFAFDSLQQEEDHVLLTFTGGRRVRAQVAIGADGNQSGVREEILKDGPPEFAGTAFWRGNCPKKDFWDFEEGPIIVGCVDPGNVRQVFAVYFLPDGMWSWQAFAPWPAENVGALLSRRYIDVAATESQNSTKRERCLSAFRAMGFPQVVLETIESTPLNQLTEHGQLFREPDTCRSWVRGRVALLGDSAHLMTPMLAQGLNQTLEDAVELGRSIGTFGPTSAALLQYEQARSPLVSIVHEGSVNMGKKVWRNNEKINELDWHAEHPEVLARKAMPLVPGMKAVASSSI